LRMNNPNTNGFFSLQSPRSLDPMRNFRWINIGEGTSRSSGMSEIDADTIKAFYCALGDGNLDFVRQCLDDGRVGVNQHILFREYYVTPVWMACRDKHIEMASFLLSRGANVDQPRSPPAAIESGASASTPLATVCAVVEATGPETGCPDLAQLLLSHGADVHLGKPLYRAVSFKRIRNAADEQVWLRLLRILLHHGADIHRVYVTQYFQESPLDKLLEPYRHTGACWSRLRYPGVPVLLRNAYAILVRKCVLGPAAEHPSRRIEHQVLLIVSFLI